DDRAHLAASRHRTVNFGTRPALLLIDLYRGVFGDAPLPLLEGIKLWSGYCGMTAWDALPRIQTLLGTARDVGIPVIHVTGLADAGMPGWNEAAHRDYESREPTDPAAQERYQRRYDIVSELAPTAEETVLRK